MAFRDGPFENLKVPLAWTAAVVVLIAIVASVLLLIGDRRGSPEAGGAPVRAGFDAATAPASGVLSAPVRWTGSVSDYIGGYFFAIAENRELRRENAELRLWRDQAIALKNINGRYEAMLGLRTEPPVPMTTARAISESRGPFANTKLLDTGSAKGVRIGNPVVNDHGLVGRIIGVSPNVSRMLSLTDVASRTPVLIDRTDARALLTGDGSGNPKLAFVRGADSVRPGDRILSSGDGGGFPRGVPIGVAAKGLDGSWRVKLFSDLGPIDYVRVLLFDNFSQLADPAALNAPPLAGLTTAPAPDAAQSVAIADAAVRRAAVVAAQAERVRAATAAQAAAPPPASPSRTASSPAAVATPRPASPAPAAPRPSTAATLNAAPPSGASPTVVPPSAADPAPAPATPPVGGAG